jgi:hypothetical protein
MGEPSHSKFSASAASRWLSCPGSMVLYKGAPDSSSVYAAWGTVAHKLADECIRCSLTLELPDDAQNIEQDGHTITVDQEMVDCVNTYLANLREMTATADILTGEMRVNYAEWLCVERDQAWGTADAIAVVGTELQIHDLKTGMGVEVDAEGNEQMLLYAGGALLEYQDLADIQTVRMVVHQPRIEKAPSEWALDVDELKAWLTGRARSGAASVLNAEGWAEKEHKQALTADTWQNMFLNPTEKGCRWCKAKATCPALRQEAVSTMTAGGNAATPEEFDDAVNYILEPKAQEALWLSRIMDKADMLEGWIKAVRAETERRLLAGENIPAYKLVQGKRGARAWTDEAAAEALLKSFRLKADEMYQFKVITPTAADKLVEAGTIGPRQAPKLKALIVQRDGKPHVAPLSDKRPALEIKPVADEFEPTTEDLV